MVKVLGSCAPPWLGQPETAPTQASTRKGTAKPYISLKKQH